MKKGAIFDMDGLLLDTERIYRENWERAAEDFGLALHPDFLPAICGTNGASSVAAIRRFYPGIDPQAFIHACFARTEAMLAKGVPEKPGAREILAFFQDRDVGIAVASSSGRRVILDNLRRAELAAYFEVVASGEDVANGKPAPDIFLLAAQRLGLAPEECYVFEDSINGARAGMAAGCATVVVPDLIPPTEDLRSSSAGIYPSLHAAREAIAAGIL